MRIAPVSGTYSIPKGLYFSINLNNLSFVINTTFDLSIPIKYQHKENDSRLSVL